MTFISLAGLVTTTAIAVLSSGVGASAADSLTSASSTFATPSPSPSPTMQTVPFFLAGPETGDGEDTGECRLLGPFSLLVQAALGALALLSLVYKRWRERPQRPLKVWTFDVSKQVFGSAMLHLANLLMSMFSAGQLEIRSKYKPNPCSFYILNLGIDTTLGIPILIFILHLLNRLASYTPLAEPPESIESGNYGRPPRASWWFKQSIIYFMGLLGMKICVFFLIQLLPFIVKVGDWALRWTEGNTAVQIIFVMLLFPVIMNAIQYYIIDTFIKKPLSQDTLESEPEGEDYSHEHRHALLAGLDDGPFESDDDSVGKDDGPGLDNPDQGKEDLVRFESVEYNPATHGERSSASSASASARSGSSHGEYGQLSSSTKLASRDRD
ncbi:vacuolar membrane protein [Aspergillus sclerotiicarbonarius CBS 121057]|uniref:Vacuolar membrane protein n=1 Tax=Aspergillus sclerotiicarbonarius (strain CBS 121057 / IBT 28362) TaxID=1448318 RepID=A0A319EAX0_ASPSB|nr:vacuolar membrane protein [Aspergillus sclerotiicarbonarius CBS 121057]